MELGRTYYLSEIPELYEDHDCWWTRTSSKGTGLYGGLATFIKYGDMLLYRTWDDNCGICPSVMI